MRIVCKVNSFLNILTILFIIPVEACHSELDSESRKGQASSGFRNKSGMTVKESIRSQTLDRSNIY